MADGSGYLQAVETETLMRLASEHDLLLRLRHRPGAFIAAGDALVQAWPRERCNDQIAACIKDAFILVLCQT
jgi:uncharacterized membrane protein